MAYRHVRLPAADGEGAADIVWRADEELEPQGLKSEHSRVQH